MRNEINMSDEQIAEMFNNEFDLSLDYDEVIFTRDSLESFIESRKGLSEPGHITVQTERTLVVERLQVAKGQPRTDLYVIDFGAVRGCYK